MAAQQLTDAKQNYSTPAKTMTTEGSFSSVSTGLSTGLGSNQSLRSTEDLNDYQNEPDDKVSRTLDYDSASPQAEASRQETIVGTRGKTDVDKTLPRRIEGKPAITRKLQDTCRCDRMKVRLPSERSGATKAGGAFAIDVSWCDGGEPKRCMRTYKQFQVLCHRIRARDARAYGHIKAPFPGRWLLNMFRDHEFYRSRLEAWLRSVIAACPQKHVLNEELAIFLA